MNSNGKNDGGAYAPERLDLVTLRAALTEQDQEQARIMRAWVADLRRAQQAGDWRAVAAVAAGLETTAHLLEAFTAELRGVGA